MGISQYTLDRNWFSKIHPDLSLRNSCPNHILLPDPVHPVQITDRFLHPISAQNIKQLGAGCVGVIRFIRRSMCHPVYKPGIDCSETQRMFLCQCFCTFYIFFQPCQFRSRKIRRKRKPCLFRIISAAPVFSTRRQISAALAHCQTTACAIAFPVSFPRQEKFLSDC